MCSHVEGDNQGKIKLMLKENYKNDESNKLISTTACEDNVLKITTKCYKEHASKEIELIEKSHLMSHGSKTNYLMQLFTQETSTQRALGQKQIKWLSKELATTHALENDEALTDSMPNNNIFWTLFYSRCIL